MTPLDPKDPAAKATGPEIPGAAENLTKPDPASITVSVTPDGELGEEVLEEIVGGLRHNPYFTFAERPPV